MDITGDVREEIASHTKQAGSGVLEDIKKIPGTFVRQVTGKSNAELDAAQKADEQFSNDAHAQLVKKIYEDYDIKEARKKQLAQNQEVRQEDADKLADLNERKQQTQQDVAVAVGKSSAETSRSYGSE